MRVYCPCEKECSAYSGSARKCNRVETSEVIPSRFVRHVAGKVGESTDNFWGALFGGLLVAGGAMALSASDDTSYEVWQCPGCHCEVLLQIIKQGGDMRTDTLGEISSC